MKEENSLLAKWLAGTITPDELQELQKDQELDLPKLEQVLKRQKDFDITTNSDEMMWQDFEKKVATVDSSKKSNNYKRNYILGISLIFILGLIGGLMYLGSRDTLQKIETSPAKTEEIIYADGTKIHVSPRSIIQYNEKTWTTQRKVFLEGQAFFEVEKGSPFTVITEQGQINVLGTKFDIWEMDELSLIHI